VPAGPQRSAFDRIYVIRTCASEDILDSAGTVTAYNNQAHPA
jgi:hypothetical protein